MKILSVNPNTSKILLAENIQPPLLKTKIENCCLNLDYKLDTVTNTDTEMHAQASNGSQTLAVSFYWNSTDKTLYLTSLQDNNLEETENLFQILSKKWTLLDFGRFLLSQLRGR